VAAQSVAAPLAAAGTGASGALNSQTLLVWFGLLTLGISLALTLLIVTTGFALLAEHVRPGQAAVWPLLIFTCTVAGLTCAVLALLQFVQLGVSRRADTDDVRDEERWTEDLLAWSYTGLALPRPLNRSGVAALLKLRDSLEGEVSDRLRDLYEQQGWLAGDLARLGRRTLPLVTRAEVIERLALLRHPVALDALAGELAHANSEIRALALLAVARSVGRLNLPPGQQRRLSQTLRGAVVGGRFSVGQLQETLTLLDDAGLPLARELLHHADPGLCAATLDVLARRRSPALHDEVLPLLHAPHPEVRAGALKVLARSRDVPPEARAAALDLSYDPLPFVRVQATKVAAQLEPLPELGCGCCWATRTGGCAAPPPGAWPDTRSARRCWPARPSGTPTATPAIWRVARCKAGAADDGLPGTADPAVFHGAQRLLRAGGVPRQPGTGAAHPAPPERGPDRAAQPRVLQAGQHPGARLQRGRDHPRRRGVLSGAALPRV